MVVGLETDNRVCRRKILSVKKRKCKTIVDNSHEIGKNIVFTQMTCQYEILRGKYVFPHCPWKISTRSFVETI